MNPQVTLSSQITWLTITGATSYQITAQDSVGTNILPPTDIGNVLAASVGAFLSGRPAAVGYQLFVRAINATENGPWAQLNVDLVPSLTAPVLTVA